MRDLIRARHGRNRVNVSLPKLGKFTFVKTFKVYLQKIYPLIASTEYTFSQDVIMRALDAPASTE